MALVRNSLGVCLFLALKGINKDSALIKWTLNSFSICGLLWISTVNATDSTQATPHNVLAKKLCCGTYTSTGWQDPYMYMAGQKDYHYDSKVFSNQGASYHEMLNCPVGYVSMGVTYGFWDGSNSYWRVTCLSLESQCQWIDQGVNTINVNAYFKYCDPSGCQVIPQLPQHYNMPCTVITA